MSKNISGRLRTSKMDRGTPKWRPAHLGFFYCCMEGTGYLDIKRALIQERINLLRNYK